MLYCEFCNRECKNKMSFVKHQKQCKSNPDRKPSWLELNPFAFKRTNQHIKAKETGIPFIVSEETKKKLSLSSSNIEWTEERKQKHSASMKLAVKAYPDSYTSSNRGRTKQIEKYGIKFQGNWELQYYEYCIRSNIKIERCEEWFPYEWNGQRSYNPDFYLPETDTYVEVKGYETDRDRAKWRDFPKTLKIIKAKELKEYSATVA